MKAFAASIVTSISRKLEIDSSTNHCFVAFMLFLVVYVLSQRERCWYCRCLNHNVQVLKISFSLVSVSHHFTRCGATIESLSWKTTCVWLLWCLHTCTSFSYYFVVLLLSFDAAPKRAGEKHIAQQREIENILLTVGIRSSQPAMQYNVLYVWVRRSKYVVIFTRFA